MLNRQSEAVLTTDWRSNAEKVEAEESLGNKYADMLLGSAILNVACDNRKMHNIGLILLIC